MLSEAYQRVATLQLGSNCCSFVAIFAALKSERALKVTCSGAWKNNIGEPGFYLLGGGCVYLSISCSLR